MTIPFTIVAFIAAALIVWLFSRQKGKPTIDSFLVAERAIPLKWGITTVLANWVQAPSLLLSGVFAYQGEWHFLMFLVPNVLALVLMGFLAPRMQETLPRGYTMPQCMGSVYGGRVRTLFFVLALASLVFAIGYTLTGLRQWFSAQLGISPMTMTLILGVYAVLCVMPKGLPGAVIGDAVKVGIVASLIGGVAYLHYLYGGMERIGTVSEALPAAGLSPGMIFWTLGIPLSISLLGGPICNPDLSERSYALKREVVRKAYFWAAGVFCAVVVTFGSLGFLAKTHGLMVVSPSIPAFQVLQDVSPSGVTIGVSIALMVILGAALASFLASTGDLIVVEVYRRFFRPDAGDEETIWFGRVCMMIPVMIGAYIASIPKVDMSIIVQSMAVIRGEAIIPFIGAVLFGKCMSERSVFAGMLVGAIGGILLTFGASLSEGYLGTKIPFLAVNGKSLGALFAVLAPTIFMSLSFAFLKFGGRRSAQLV
ncbi:MAG: hypothetical protein KA054_03550 [Candidatus Moranbacteria bacterium]|nr:hypothetical protein [Candidatus Moranbacteria bacterium]